jgi:hypothetical protein
MASKRAFTITKQEIEYALSPRSLRLVLGCELWLLGEQSRYLGLAPRFQRGGAHVSETVDLTEESKHILVGWQVDDRHEVVLAQGVVELHLSPAALGFVEHSQISAYPSSPPAGHGQYSCRVRYSDAFSLRFTS